jgi:WD40 repeat protein
LATGSEDKTVKIWSVEGKELWKGQHSKAVTAVTFSPDGKFLVSVGDENIKFWSMDPVHSEMLGQKQFSLPSPHNDDVINLDFSPDGKMLATASTDGKVDLWEIHLPLNSERDVRVIQTLKANSGFIQGVRFNPDGQTLVTIDSTGIIKFWSTAGEELHAFQEHLEMGISLSFSPDGKILASAAENDNRVIWRCCMKRGCGG